MDDRPRPLDRALTWLQATPAEAAGLVALLLGALVATALLVLQAQQRPGADGAAAAGVGAEVDAEPGSAGGVEAADGRGADTATDGHGDAGHDPQATAAPTTLVVHVTGAVVRPGVVDLDAGARVTDAIAAAGGATEEARLDYLNLARPLEDGEHVHLPREGEDPPTATGADGGGAGSDPAPIDLNDATAEQLQTLPGIGPAKAAAIVRHREEHGPFGVPGDLRDVPGIGEATFQRLADLVTVS